MLIDRLNLWVINRLQHLREQRRGKMTISTAGLIIQKKGQNHQVAWTAIESIIAKRTDHMVGDTISLTITTRDGLTAQATEDDAEWSALIAGISDHLVGCLPYARWALALVAGEVTIPVYRRGAVPDL
ncbi:hypothetical protein UCD39_14960 [Nitrospirillum sp. BR 11752]|uniref:hypothetical protein n=1 Tax=Nitrospirillum sp. BR 11752 TaxID=3104293 RepID=UPI002EBD5E24|nr:hypothetical protein [Nitrospirillum sp. BR 11752]